MVIGLSALPFEIMPGNSQSDSRFLLNYDNYDNNMLTTVMTIYS